MNKIKLFLYNNIMIVATFFFSGAFIAGKFSIAEFPPIQLTFFRFSIAGIILFIILFFQKRPLTVPKNEIPNIIILAIVGMIGYHVFFFTALKYTTSTNSALISSITPVTTSIFAGIILKENFNKQTGLGVILSFLGVVFLITNGSIKTLLNFSFNSGDIFMLCAVLCFSGYLLILKGVLKRINPYTLTAYVFISCAILLLPFILMNGNLNFIGNTSLKGWGSVFYMSIFASIFAYLIQQISVQRIGVIKTSLYININPIFSMILAYLILGEKIALIKIVATCIILFGVILTIKSKEN